MNGKFAGVGLSSTSSCDENTSPCTAGDSASPVCGMWNKLDVSIKAPNLLVHANTCSQLTDFNARLSVYSGFCDNLSCVWTKDLQDFSPTCGEGHTVLWRVSPGVPYYVLVYSTALDTGSFSLVLERS